MPLHTPRSSRFQQTGAIHFIGLFIIVAIVLIGYFQFTSEAKKQEQADKLHDYCMELAKRGVTTRSCEGMAAALKTPAANTQNP